MPGPIDAVVEVHRRDPDPHPRLGQRVATLETAVDELTESGGAPVGDAAPKTVRVDAGQSAGTSPNAAREDHRHMLQLPQEVIDEPLARANADVAEAAARSSADLALFVYARRLAWFGGGR